jgi:hypothetical protein
MQKTAHYRKAIWLTADGQTPYVGDYLIQALNSKLSVADTKFEYKPGVDVQVSARNIAGNSIACHFTLYSEGRPTGTVENGGPSVGRASAPAGQEFLRSGLHFIIDRNHLIYVADGHTNDGQINGLIHKFFIHCGLHVDSTKFGFMPRANRREIDTLLRQGVKSIDMGLSDFATAIGEIQDDNANPNALQNVWDVAVNQVANTLGHHRTPDERLAASDIEARLQLSFDGRSSAELVPQLMGRIASDIYGEYTNDFKIITKNDVVITRDRLVLKRDITVDGDDVIINTNSAFDALRHTLNEWNGAGLLND